MAKRGVISSPMGRAMFQDTLLRLMGGAKLMPHEQEMLSMAPLPEIITSPFTDQESNLPETLRATAKALDIWDEEVRKIDYFTKHFTDLSKMIMQGVTTLGRGLASLHAMGEDLSLSPKSIQDLIMIASYHFRKSYLGVLQTVKKYPEISTRLLANQVNWANMIFRLNMTKVKLSKPVGNKKEEIKNKNSIDGSLSPHELNDGQGTGEIQKPEDGAFAPLELNAGSGLDALSPVTEASTIGASRAFTPLKNQKEETDRKKSLAAAGAGTVTESSSLSRGSSCAGEKTGEARSAQCSHPSHPAKEQKNSNNEKPESRNSESEEPESEVKEAGELPPAEESPIEQALTPEKEIREKPREPKYLEIIKASLERNRDHPDQFPFTPEDLKKLTSDQEFCRDEPEAAEQFRFFLMRAGP